MASIRQNIATLGANIYRLAAPKQTTLPKSQAEKIVIDIIKTQRTMARREMDELLTARTVRHNPTMPKTFQLQNIYLDIMQDAHLTAIIENNRILPVKNKNFVIRNTKDEADHEKSKLLKKRWFKEVVQFALESRFYGYTLIHIAEAGSGQVGKVEKLPRQHVIPEKNLLLKEQGDEKGIDYTQFPEWLLYAQLGSDAIGLLEKAAPLTIIKRHSWANWDEFEQIFGIPIRIAKTVSQSKKVQEEIQGWLEEMGTAAYAIFPQGTEVEIKENNSKDAFQVFFQKIQAVNQELSKLILGQTGTTDEKAFSGSAEVHKETLTEIITADIDDLLLWMADVLTPALRVHGFPIGDTDYISVDSSIAYTPKDRVEIDSKLMQYSGYKFKKEYLEKTYSVELDDVAPAGEPVEPPASKKKSPVKP
jgi:hypothetical protein